MKMYEVNVDVNCGEYRICICQTQCQEVAEIVALLARRVPGQGEVFILESEA